ncbi:hypothetical protein VSO49_06210 [Myroides odoratimimus]|uniref:hypothetical protein n=1 Tax=Myroides odoratimimus TaxID=76832 RepID=UPI002DBD32C1|nr:hypothetical protein [Myroides odoratimimus]MEC4075939.1 hypothetical protein [Myroides odoratimimus]
MNISTYIAYYTKGLKDRLEVVRPTMIDSLCSLFVREYIPLVDPCTVRDVDTFYFEYDYETLDIVVWAEDKAEQVISSISMGIPENLSDNLFPRELYFSLHNLEESWTETEDGEEMYDELMQTLSEQQERILEFWFTQCWLEAKTKTGASIKGKFSIHDTTYRTELP